MTTAQALTALADYTLAPTFINYVLSQVSYPDQYTADSLEPMMALLEDHFRTRTSISFNGIFARAAIAALEMEVCGDTGMRTSKGKSPYIFEFDGGYTRQVTIWMPRSNMSAFIGEDGRTIRPIQVALERLSVLLKVEEFVGFGPYVSVSQQHFAWRVSLEPVPERHHGPKYAILDQSIGKVAAFAAQMAERNGFRPVIWE